MKSTLFHKYSQGEVRSDCLAYNVRTNEWTDHSSLLSPREEAASVVVKENDALYIFGGFVDNVRVATAERNEGDGWDDSVNQMPEAR